MLARRTTLIEEGLALARQYLQDALPPCTITNIDPNGPEGALDRFRMTRSMWIQLYGPRRLSFSSDVLEHLAKQPRERARGILRQWDLAGYLQTVTQTPVLVTMEDGPQRVI